MTSRTVAMERIARRVDKLHSSPGVASKVVALLQNEDFDIYELTDLLESDPALTASILRRANSSFYGCPIEISTLHRAVMMLGSRSVRLIVLSFGLLKQLSNDTPAQVFHEYWKNSLTMAVSAIQVASLDGGVSQDEAYCAGLLSDVGVLVLAQVHTDQYVSLYKQHHQSANLIVEEEKRFGFNHSDLGAYILRKWNLPESLCQAVLHHHKPPLTLSGLDFAVAVSDLMATSLWTPESASVVTAQQLLQESFSVGVEGFITLATNIQQGINENAELFAVNIQETIDCETLLETAKQQYADVEKESAADVESV